MRGQCQTRDRHSVPAARLGFNPPLPMARRRLKPPTLVNRFEQKNTGPGGGLIADKKVMLNFHALCVKNIHDEFIQIAKFGPQF